VARLRLTGPHSSQWYRTNSSRRSPPRSGRACCVCAAEGAGFRRQPARTMRLVRPTGGHPGRGAALRPRGRGSGRRPGAGTTLPGCFPFLCRVGQLQTRPDQTGRDGTGRDGTGRDGSAESRAGPSSTYHIYLYAPPTVRGGRPTPGSPFWNSCVAHLHRSVSTRRPIGGRCRGTAGWLAAETHPPQRQLRSRCRRRSSAAGGAGPASPEASQPAPHRPDPLRSPEQFRLLRAHAVCTHARSFCPASCAARAFPSGPGTPTAAIPRSQRTTVIRERRFKCRPRDQPRRPARTQPRPKRDPLPHTRPSESPHR